MSTKITPESIHETLDSINYDPDECTEVIELEADVFQDLALVAHELDITVNALVAAILHSKCVDDGMFDPPSIPGVGTAPYMEDWKD